MKQNLNSFQLSDEDLQIIEERRKSYEAGESKVYTLAELKRKISKSLQAKKSRKK